MESIATARPAAWDVYCASKAVGKVRRPEPKPKIKGPDIFGVRPGRPILHSIAVTGERPLHFSAEGLPSGVRLDPLSGRLSGSVAIPGSYSLHLHVSNAHGAASRVLQMEVGELHALTPPMGWNSWNCWGGSVSESKVLAAAEAMVASGLAQHGWTYVNIDDGWQGVRGGPLNAIQPNKKFQNMGQLGKRIHELGLKLGIYSTPWIGTYEGHIGSYADSTDGTYPWVDMQDHNEFVRIGRSGEEDWDRKRRTNWTHGRHSFIAADIAQWSTWGVDFLKYDWKPNDITRTREVAQQLEMAERDMVLSLSNKAPFWVVSELSRHANCWRTTSDIQDTWESVASIGFNQDRWCAYGGPGHWNDPDMLVLGNVGWGSNLRPTRLTREEQCTHFGLWCLLAAPLILGCDLSNLDEFTLSLLTNDEVIDVDQDRLGIQATRVGGRLDTSVLAKPMADGSIVAGLFNLRSDPAGVTLEWDDLHIEGPWSVRDLWSQMTEGIYDSRLETTLPAHGSKLVRMWHAGNESNLKK